MKRLRLGEKIFFVMALICLLGSVEENAFAIGFMDKSVTEAEQSAPQYDITINIVPQSGWLRSNSKVDIKVIDNKNTGTFQIAKVEAKIGADGKWEDITDSMQVEVAEKCAVYVVVTDAYGTTYSQTRYIDGYDSTAPTFNVAVNNGVMTIETNDNESGVAAVYVNGYKFKTNSKGKLTVRLQRFDATYKEFTIYCVDHSGNESESYIIDNPYYNDGTQDDEKETNPANALPASGEAAVKGEASASVVGVTDEDGNDISEDVTTKQFYNIITKDGQQFYLVIDMSAGERFEGSTDTPGGSGEGTVYFLTYVSNNDLLNVTGSDEVTLGYNSVASSNGIDEDAVSDEPVEKTETQDASEEIPTEKKSSGGMDPMVILIVVLVAAAIVVVKAKSSGKSRTPVEDEDMEEYDDYAEESIPLSELNEMDNEDE